MKPTGKAIASGVCVAAALLSAPGCGQKRAARVDQASPAAPRPSVLASMQPAMAQQVRNAVYAGEGDPVARTLRQRIAADPSDLDARLRLGEHYEKQGFGDLALEHYRIASERFPSDARVAVALAQGLHNSGQTREAADQLARFLNDHPAQTPDGPAWLGMLHDALGEWAAGESAHRAALALSGSNAKLHNNLGYNLWKQSKRIDAIEAFRRALALDPKLEIARNNLGLALMENAGPVEMKEALGHFTAATADPAAAHNNAAAVLIEQGRLAEARSELQESLRHRPDYLPALRNLELVSKLDHSPAALPDRFQQGKQAAHESRLERWASILWHGFLGTERKKTQSGLPVAGNR